MHKHKFYEAFFDSLNVRGFCVDHDLLYYLIQLDITTDCKCLVLPWLSYIDRGYDEDKFQDILSITDTWEEAWLFVMGQGVRYCGNNPYLITVSKLYD